MAVPGAELDGRRVHQLDFVLAVRRGAEGDFGGPAAGADEVAVGEVGAVDDVGVVGAADEAVFAGEFVNELHGGVVGGARCEEKGGI